MSTPMTAAPARLICATTSAPIPPPAPVTMPTLPVRSNMIGFLRSLRLWIHQLHSGLTLIEQLECLCIHSHRVEMSVLIFTALNNLTGRMEGGIGKDKQTHPLPKTHLSLAFTTSSASAQSSGVLMSNASSPSRMNGITASPLMVLVCHTASVLTTSSPAVCTYTSRNSPVWLLCQGVSFNRYGMSGSILKPCAIHILPGCSLTLRTARTLSAFLSDCSRFTALAIVSALRKGEVHRRIATMSAR